MAFATTTTVDSTGNYIYSNKMACPLDWHPFDEEARRHLLCNATAVANGEKFGLLREFAFEAEWSALPRNRITGADGVMTIAPMLPFALPTDPPEDANQPAMMRFNAINPKHISNQKALANAKRIYFAALSPSLQANIVAREPYFSVSVQFAR